MPRTSWATPEDVTALLTSAGITSIPEALDLEGQIATSVAGLEDVGYRPFLAAEEATERRFDPPGARQRNTTVLGGGQLLSLQGGAVAIESVSVDLGSGPEELDAGRWYPAPGGAPDRGQPYTCIRFAYATFSVPEGVTVLARWGYADQIPDLAWKAVLYDTALEILPLIGSGQVQSALASAASLEGVQIKAKESGPVRLEYQTIDPLKAAQFEGLFRSWMRGRESGFARYRLEDL